MGLVIEVFEKIRLELVIVAFSLLGVIGCTKLEEFTIVLVEAVLVDGMESVDKLNFP
jgi:hypothetical protein